MYARRMANIRDNNRDLSQETLKEEREVRRWMTMSRAPYPTRWKKQIESNEDNEEISSNKHNETAVNDSRKFATFGVSIDDDDDGGLPNDGGDTETVGSIQRDVSHVEGKKAQHWRYIGRYALYHTQHPRGFNPDNALSHPAMLHVPPHLRALASEYLAEMLKLHASESVSEDDRLSPEGVIASLFGEVQAAEAGSAYALDWQALRETKNTHAKLATRLVRDRANARANGPGEPEPEWLQADRAGEKEGKEKMVSFGEIPPGHDDGEHTRFPRGGDKKRHRIEAHNILGDFREHMEREKMRLIEFLRAEKEERLRSKQKVIDLLERRAVQVSEAGPSNISRMPTPPLQEPSRESAEANNGVDQPLRSLHRMSSMHSMNGIVYPSAYRKQHGIHEELQPSLASSSTSHLVNRDKERDGSRQTSLEDVTSWRSRSFPSLQQLQQEKPEDTASIGENDHVISKRSNLTPDTNQYLREEPSYEKNEGEEQSARTDNKGKGKQSLVGEESDGIFPDSRTVLTSMQVSEHSSQVDTARPTSAVNETDGPCIQIEDHDNVQTGSEEIGKIVEKSILAITDDSKEANLSDIGDDSVNNGIPLVGIGIGIVDLTGDEDKNSDDDEARVDEGVHGEVSRHVTEPVAVIPPVNSRDSDKSNRSGFIVPPFLSSVNDDWLFDGQCFPRAPQSAWGHRYKPY